MASESFEAACECLNRDPAGRDVVAKVTESMAASRRQVPHPVASTGRHPVVVLEGLDGVGKSTLARNLQSQLGDTAVLLRTPLEEFSALRGHFDALAPDVRRAFYSLCNYACALQIRELAKQGPVVVDRFWPSTAAYGLAAATTSTPQVLQRRNSLEMPADLAALLPEGNPVVFLLLKLDESDRARRVRDRGLPVTEEEEVLEKNRHFRERVEVAYGSLRVEGLPLDVCDAFGTEGEVLASALDIVGRRAEEAVRLVPKSVNWHYTRICNYTCKFCFHTAKSGFFLPTDEAGMMEAERNLWKLRRSGMEKINFSGGEPFIHAEELGALCRFCKVELGISVSIISNGSKITEAWLRRFGRFVDILAVSCDSFVEETNKRIGRGTGMHLAQLEKVVEWCRAYDVQFKLNSVINVHNWGEDMSAAVERLAPVRWKVFQCLLLDGENAGEGSLRDARELVISDDQFRQFLGRHGHVGCLVPEDNNKMKDSYLILDERMRFLNCRDGSKTPGRPIQDISIRRAVREAGFDAEMFLERGGVYEWSRRAEDVEDLASTASTASTAESASRRRPAVQVRGKEGEASGSAAPPSPRALPDLKQSTMVAVCGAMVLGAVVLVGTTLAHARRRA